MPGLTLALLLLLALPGVAAAAAGPEDAEAWEAGTRRVALGADPPGRPVEVRVSPGVGTLLLFDTPPSRMEVESRPGFRGVGLEGAMLTLVPAAGFEALGQARLTVYFSDGAAPPAATFLLRAVPAALAERQLEVHRRSRSLESYVQEVRELRAENAALRGEVARLQAVQARPDGLLGLLVEGDMRRAEGVRALRLKLAPAMRPGRTLVAGEAHAFRSSLRVALEVRIQNQGAQPWRADGAALRGRAGTVLKVLRVWQAEPIAPGANGVVMVEAENTLADARGPFTLTLWEEGAQHPFTLGNITFP